MERRPIGQLGEDPFARCLVFKRQEQIFVEAFQPGVAAGIEPVRIGRGGAQRGQLLASKPLLARGYDPSRGPG